MDGRRTSTRDAHMRSTLPERPRAARVFPGGMTPPRPTHEFDEAHQVGLYPAAARTPAGAGDHLGGSPAGRGSAGEPFEGGADARVPDHVRELRRYAIRVLLPRVDRRVPLAFDRRSERTAVNPDRGWHTRREVSYNRGMLDPSGFAHSDPAPAEAAVSPATCLVRTRRCGGSRDASPRAAVGATFG